MSEAKTQIGAESGNRVTWNQRAAHAIARTMIKGANTDRRVTPEELDAFLQKHRQLIEDVFPHIPRGFSAIGAAVCKCAIYYNKRRAILFLQNLRSFLFNGEKDPVYLYHRWFNSKSRRKKDQATTYGMTIRACRTWCEYRELKRLVISDGSSKDVFEWDEEWNPIPSTDQKTPCQESPLDDQS